MRLVRTLFLGAIAFAASCAAPRAEELPGTGRASSAIGWNAGAVAPIRIRQGHTATLLGTGEILVAGGGATPKATELVRPYEGKVLLGADLVEARTSHTATMLLSGKVLLAGGKGTATAELYDPSTHTSVATGSMTQARAGHLAIRLRSGRVLVTGGRADSTTEIYDPTSGTWASGPARSGTGGSAMATLADGRIVVVAGSSPSTEVFEPSIDVGSGWSTVALGFLASGDTQTLTRLADGRMVEGFTKGCASIGGPPFCFAAMSTLDKDATAVTSGPDLVAGRQGFTAARTVRGEVLFIGGEPSESLRRVEAFDPASPGALVNDGDLTAGHIGATATVLPGGDILVIGGAQAALDRRMAPGAWKQNPFRLLHAREKHSAVRLHDGTVLVAGGEDHDVSMNKVTAVAEAEILDLAANKSTIAGTLAAAHRSGTLTTLRSGNVLVAGGDTAVSELFVPGTGFSTLPPMSVSRTGHTATLLPSGSVLVIGGTNDPSAELFDPTSATWSPLPKPSTAWTNQGAVLLPNGLVLVVGGGAAEIFDEAKHAFRPTTPPGASRDGRTAHLLANGRVFVAGGTTLAAEIFDPASETWSYTSAQTEQEVERLWTSLPDGRLVASGGHLPIENASPAMRLFDPIAHPIGTFLDLPTAPATTYSHAAALAGTGEVIAVGGQACFALCLSSSLDSISVYGDGAPDTLRPTITDAPATVVAGTKVSITGTRFANGPEASDGTRGSSPVNHPTAVWVSDAGDAVVPSTILDFTNTTATWVVPTTALYGHGQLFVNVAGVISNGRSISITPAIAATVCANDAQCGTGFCSDGVCCDTRCDGICEGCTAARKTSGADGVCGAVPPGKDIAGRCVLKLGQACAAATECGTGFCSSGVCCDSTCDGQCLSCNQAGKAGRCSAINEGSCGAACDGDHTLKQVGVPDVDCSPYKCGGPQCAQTCASAHDCVAPSVCGFDGHCVPGVEPHPASDAVCGCRAVGAKARTSAGLLLPAAFALLAFRRRRRRR